MAALQSCQPPHQVHLHNQEKIIKNLKKELPSSLFDYNISFTVNGEWIGPNTRESIKDITVVKKDQTITISHEVEE
jgi:hypothetical protein